MRKENGVYIFTEQEYQEMVKDQQEIRKAVIDLEKQIQALQTHVTGPYTAKITSNKLEKGQ